MDERAGDTCPDGPIGMPWAPWALTSRAEAAPWAAGRHRPQEVMGGRAVHPATGPAAHRQGTRGHRRGNDKENAEKSQLQKKTTAKSTKRSLRELPFSGPGGTPFSHTHRRALTWAFSEGRVRTTQPKLASVLSLHCLTSERIPQDRVSLTGNWRPDVLEGSSASWKVFGSFIFKISICFTTLQDFKNQVLGFPGGAVVKNPPANAGDTVRALVREDPTCHRATKPRVPQLLSSRATTN